MLERKSSKTMYFSIEIFTAGVRKILELIPGCLKNDTSSIAFKENVTTWTTDKYHCRICKRYIGCLGFISSF